MHLMRAAQTATAAAPQPPRVAVHPWRWGLRCATAARLARSGAALALAATSPARADLPPLPPLQPMLACSVQALSLDDSLRLRLQFDNQGDTPIELPPGPHLVYYQDSAATEAMLITARLERLPSTSLTLPPHGQAQVLMVLGGPRLAEFRCNGRPPAAAGLNFYKFSPWPKFRCVLQGYAPDTLPLRSDCPAHATPTTAPPAAQR